MTPLEKTLNGLRRNLHRNAELSDQEQRTAAVIKSFLEDCAPDQIIEKLGGHGLAAVYSAAAPGPTILFRCDMDGLPIPETVSIPHGSLHKGAAHKCGHDGHMAMVAGLAVLLRDRPPERGRVVLLFQPAEETGQGARRVLDDPSFASLAPDYVFGLHNLPGFPLGAVVSRAGVFSAASRGLKVRLEGATSHAAEPQKGRSPALAMAQLITNLSALPQFHTALHQSGKVTVIHARLGEVAFGTSPGSAEIMATLRAYEDAVMDDLSVRCESLAKNIAATHRLDEQIDWTEEFPVTVNDAAAVTLAARAAASLMLPVQRPKQPFPWSEDFGHFTASYTGALLGLGAGEEHPALHSPEYDFPDELLTIGTQLLWRIIEQSMSVE